MKVQFLRRISLWCSMVCLVLCSESAHAVTPGSYMATYTSAIDNSTQNYGLYIPASYNNFPLHSVIFIGHGFGGHASSSFNLTQTTFADANGFLLVQLEGRGNNFYDGVGEVDFLDVLAQLRALYTVDGNHLYFEGESMGATGSYRQGLRHPDFLAAVGGVDGFGDYRSWYTQYYGPASNPSYVEPFRLPNVEMSSCVDVAENAKWQNVWMQVHDGDTSVLPANTQNLNAQLNALQTPEGDYVHQILEGPGGHVASYDQAGLYNYFLTKSLNKYPLHVVCKTTQLKYGRTHWVGIDRMQTTGSFGLVDAKIEAPSGGVTAVTVTTSNVLQYTLYLNGNLIAPSQSYTIVTDGAPSSVYPGPAGTVTMYATLDSNGNITGWTTVNPFPNILHKTASIEGPIGHAYTSNFIVVYGSDPADKTEADTFCSSWNSHMEAAIASRPDSSVTDSDRASSNLILFGTASSNLVLNQIQPNLPIAVDSTGVTIGSKRYSGTNYGAYFVYPNPANTSKYVVISHKIIPGSQVKDLEALPWYWPDYVVFDTNLTAGACIQSSLNYLPSTFVEAGYFDGYWNLPASYSPQPNFSVAASPASQAVTAGASCSYNVSVTPSAGFAGTVNFGVTGLPSGASASFNPTSITSSGSSTMTVATSGATLGGSYPLTITGTSSALTHTTSVTLVVNSAPLAPNNLTATPGDTTVALSWQSSPGATSYSVLRSTATGGPYAVIGSITTSSYTDSGLTDGTTYYYVVQAVNGVGTSPNSAEVRATPNPTAPLAPTNLAASGASGTASLTWTASSRAVSYNVLRSTTSGSGYAVVTNGTGVTATTFSDTGLAAGGTYYYVVQAVNSAGTSPNSNQASITFAPASPTLSATAGNGSVSLTWTTPAGATSYSILRATTSGGTYTSVGSSTTASFTNSGLTNGTTYYYVVRAANAGGTSANSNQVSATPTVPLSITVGPSASASRTSATVTWTTSLSASGVVHYGTTTNLGSSVTGSAGTKSHSVSLGSLVRHTTYYYNVQSTAGSSTVTSATKSFTTN